MGFGDTTRWDRYGNTRKWVHGLFEVNAGGRAGFCVDYAIMVLIVANVVAVSLETVDPIYTAYGREF